ncbi:MAG: hypothetical protein BGO70_05815 [Bacteroidetes bacterium 43-93]|nr:hypothetical protein [Bacteroidota bacterium]OJW96912.1 MAG: hypothetical protein BGO70_05815 [Bacteroidetes bacterium 43-93]
MATDNKNNEQDFPGYPHYPAGEDATQPQNNNGFLSTDVPKREDNDTTIDSDDEIVMGTEADVTADEQELLASTDDYEKLDITDEDGDELVEGGLDVPGSELDDADEALGEEDEENNYYSLGDNEDVEDPNADLR